ncbi:MAG: hypothetical protein C0519_12315 [Hyphomicrobium sp.]|nr:hypothetical protein [Hyphomicrobium sp.]PPD07802.1 MAG: hypothetical protein CTY28_08185 [Hyphomicrobium sp.]
MVAFEWSKFAADRLEKRADWKNEEQTKLGAIVPFFEALGYESSDQSAFRSEATAGLATTGTGRADFAIFIESEPAIVVECKAADVPLDRHTAQLDRYMQSEQLKVAPLGVLTNGVEHRFFERIEPDQDLPEPFLILQLASIRSGEIESDQVAFLEAIHPKNFASDDVAELAKRLRVKNSIERWWRRELQNPSKEFCRMVLQNQDFSRVTEKLIGAYQPIVADAFLRSVAKEVAKILPEVRRERDGAVRLPVTKASAGAITTQREYEVFQRCLIEVAQRCQTVAERQHLTGFNHKDYSEFFKIYVGGHKKGHLLKFFEASPGQPEKFEFADGQIVHSIDEIAEPLMKNYRDAIKRLTP